MNFLWCVLLDIFFMSNADAIRPSQAKLTSFFLMTQPQYGAGILGSPWLSLDLFTCVITCQKQYTSCHSVVFNSASGLCTPGSEVKLGLPPPLSSRGDLFYYEQYCQGGFQLVVFNGFRECFFISKDKTTYQTARKDCQGRHGRVFTASLFDRFQLFAYIAQSIIGDDTWMGLYKDATRTWIWENGVPLNTSLLSSYFATGEPNNSGGNQECSSGMKHLDGLLDDAWCSSVFCYVCEIDF